MESLRKLRKCLITEKLVGSRRFSRQSREELGFNRSNRLVCKLTIWWLNH